MVPLNMYFAGRNRSRRFNGEGQCDYRVRQRTQRPDRREYFPGDLLFKNFGVTRGGRVVFYDYDEIEYLTDCRFRPIPKPRYDEDDVAGEIWFSVDRFDVFPEEFAKFY